MQIYGQQWQMAIVKIGLDGVKEEETQGRRLDEIGPWLPQKYTCKQDGKRLGQFACLSAKQGLDIIYAKPESVVMQCMLCRESEMAGKGELKSKGRVLLAIEHASHMQKSLVSRLKVENKCNIKVQ
jgi:hypothetical protein